VKVNDVPRTLVRRSPARISYRDRLRAYETAKATWLALHPHATAGEVQEAVLRIARECRI
jgi:hypothetical protein